MHVQADPADLVELPDHALVDDIGQLELRLRSLDAELSAAIALADRRNVCAADGHRSMAPFLRATLNWSTAEANRFLGPSRASDGVAGFGEAWYSGPPASRRRL